MAYNCRHRFGGIAVEGNGDFLLPGRRQFQSQQSTTIRIGNKIRGFFFLSNAKVELIVQRTRFHRRIPERYSKKQAEVVAQEVYHSFAVQLWDDAMDLEFIIF